MEHLVPFYAEKSSEYKKDMDVRKYADPHHRILSDALLMAATRIIFASGQLQLRTPSSRAKG